MLQCAAEGGVQIRHMVELLVTLNSPCSIDHGTCTIPQKHSGMLILLQISECWSRNNGCAKLIKQLRKFVDEPLIGPVSADVPQNFLPQYLPFVQTSNLQGMPQKNLLIGTLLQAYNIYVTEVSPTCHLMALNCRSASREGNPAEML